MKRNLAFLLISAMLVFSLTACGCTATPQSNNDTGSTQNTTQPNGTETQNDKNQNNTQNNGSAVIGHDNGNTHDNGTNTQNPIGEGVDDIVDGIDNAVDDVTGQNNNTANDGGVPYDQMLNNGRVKR